MRFDALLVVSFGGPEGPDDVLPFLGNVVQGRRVPPERLAKVAEQYRHFGGVSPINAHNRRLVGDLRAEIARRGRELPVFWGNRNWYPFLPEALSGMRDAGVERAAALVTSAYSSYSSCRQYIDNIEEARKVVGPGAPEVLKLRPFFNHPGFVLPFADRLGSAMAASDPTPGATAVLMTAHSLPKSMADGCDYERQLLEVARLVAEGAADGAGAGAGADRPWQLVFQSRSGPPEQPWLGPDINDAIAALPDSVSTVIAVPIGFVSDHMEVVHDLDLVAARAALSRGMRFVRVATPIQDPRFVSMVVDLVEEAEDPRATPVAMGPLGPAAFPCRPGCCPPAV